MTLLNLLLYYFLKNIFARQFRCGVKTLKKNNTFFALELQTPFLFQKKLHGNSECERFLRDINSTLISFKIANNNRARPPQVTNRHPPLLHTVF